MKYYIIFIVTIILALFIYFYNPNSKYLGVYKDNFYIEYSYDDENYFWEYDNNEILKIEEVSNSKWKLVPLKDGISKITFYYKNINNPDDSKYIIYYEFKVSKNKIYWTNGYAKGLLDYPDPY